MSQCDADKWNKIYQVSGHGSGRACQVLEEYFHLLPSTGTALDLACGLGGNALLLAKHGLVTSAWDISETVIAHLDADAKQQGLIIATRVVDIVQNPPATDSFDIIVVSRFLARQLVPFIKEAIRTNGLLFYQTYTKTRTDEKGPKDPDYLLNDNELLSLFHDFHILSYHEEGTTGDTALGYRNEAMLVAQKRM